MQRNGLDCYLAVVLLYIFRLVDNAEATIAHLPKNAIATFQQRWVHQFRGTLRGKRRSDFHGGAAGETRPGFSHISSPTTEAIVIRSYHTLFPLSPYRKYL